MAELPTGTVTILFTDIEGSTRLLQQLGANDYARLLSEHHRLMRAAIAAGHGVEVKTEGDAFFAVFVRAADAVTAAAQAQRDLAACAWPTGVRVAVRMGVHTGDVELSEGEYLGLDVHRAARVAAAAHGGQVLISSTTGAMVAGSLPPGVAVRDLGEHLLKDIDAPEHLLQLVIAGLTADFPPPRAAATRFDLLPAEMSSFVGREAVLDQAGQLLHGTRLLTLTGPGGTGKTRIAIRLARTVAAEFADGAAFVALAAITDPRLVLPSIRQALGLIEQPGRSALETLSERLAGRQVVVVLDNFEQIAAAAGAIGQLLEAAPGLTLIVTSRVALHLTGEQELAVPPLAVPSGAELADLEQLSNSETVALFVQRARAVRPDFTLSSDNAPVVVAICARLDGLPLAIELAASRVKLLPPAALLARLVKSLDVLQSTTADRTDRQRTLRGAIDWSYGLLTEDEQALFRRCAIFVGGWRLDDGESVAGAAGVLDVDLLDGIDALVDHSLMRQVAAGDEPRFAMLETIREFGCERLEAAGELEATADAHARRFAELAREAEPLLTAGREWPDRLEADHANIRAALAWLAKRDTDLALLTAGRLWRFWHLRGHLREGAATLSALLQGSAAGGGTPARAKALLGLAGLVYWQTDFELARTSYEEALAIARAHDETRMQVEALYSLGYVRAIERDWDAAIADLRAAIAVAGERGGELMLASTEMAIGLVTTLRGDHEAALEVLAGLPSRFEALGDSFGIRNAMSVECRALMQLGRLDESAARNRRMLELALADGDNTSLSAGLHDAASLAALRDDLERAALLTGAAERLIEESGGQAPPELVNRIAARPTLERDLPPARLADLLSEGRRLTLDDAAELALRLRT